MRATGWLFTVLVMLTSAGCATGGREAGTGPRSTGTVITAEEIRDRGGYSNLYDLIQTLRPRWIQTRGPDTFMGQQGQVQVHMDGNRLGPVTALRSLSPTGVTSIRWLSPNEASSLYGLDHSHGAIIISTRPVH
jgi:hypothetical protein